MTDPSLAPKLRVIGRYSILKELHRGKHSVSYSAVDPVMNRQLVVKAVELLPANPRLSADERKRVEQAFVRQAQAAGRLQHPHIVTVFDAGLSHAFGFLVIERVNGHLLSELIGAGVRPSFVQCASIGARLADAIEYAHANGVAHGHLGPQHVFLLADGTPKVSGFGGWIDDGATGDEALAGTSRLLPYFQNEITEASRRQDVRALGALLYMMLVGHAPPESIAAGGASACLAARPDTPPALARLVDHALGAGAAKGLASAAALRDALTAYLWTERGGDTPSAELGIPLAPPPARAPVHVATLPPGALAPATSDPVPAAGPAPAPATVNTATASDDPLPAPWSGVVERLRPWALKNRIGLFSAGTLLTIGVFLGVILANLRHAEVKGQVPAAAVAAAGAVAAAADSADPVVASAPAAAALVTVHFAIRPWGEILVDGKPTGVAPPLQTLRLRAGRHRFEIRHPGSPVWSAEIEVPASGDTTVEHLFE